jgi:DNA mismatch repair protein MSH6
MAARGLLNENTTTGRESDNGSDRDPFALDNSSADEWSRQHPWSVDVRDALGRAPNDPEYDPSTIYVPEEAERRMTPFQRQFWEIKRHHYNTVLLFKKGKFYECYDVDADIGHRVLQLNYTGSGRADMRCVGVPESAFFRHAVRLVDAGYRVGRVEQVETVLAAKNNASKICARRLVRILTKSTIVDESGDDLYGDPRYLMAIVERAWTDGPGTAALGVCYLNVATASVHFGVLLTDDERFTKLEALLVRVRPREVILDSSSERLEFLARSCSASDVQVHRCSLESVFADTSLMDKVLDICTDALALRALQGAFDFLRKLLIADQVIPLGNFFSLNETLPAEQCERLELDAAAIEGLELFRNTADHSSDNSLFAFLDRCATNMGRRCLRRWLCHPFSELERIQDRLDAVEDIHRFFTASSDAEGGGTELRQQMQQNLRCLPDLERSLARVHTMAVDQHGAVMFDDTNQRKVRDFLNTLESLELALGIVRKIRETLGDPAQSLLRSRRLVWLLSDAALPLVQAEETLAQFLRGHVFDLDAARQAGILRPAAESIAHVASAHREKQRIENEMEAELTSVRQRLGRVPMRFYHRVQERYQIELPADFKNVPEDFVLMSQTKQYRRYWTPNIRHLLKTLSRVEEEIEMAEHEFARTVFMRFDASYSLWLALARMLGEWDALSSLARVSFDHIEQLSMTRPIFGDIPGGCINDAASAAFAFQELWHPILAFRSGPSQFVPNNVQLDASKYPSMVLTGPNMSGKSALLRQVGIAVILAQMGCYVPASSAYIRVPVDRLFTRIGARDRLTRAQSTFMVEMLETAEVLQHATNRSLVILDELGRGTSTFDGYAIAYAVLQYLTFETRCLTLFATHYHQLAEESALRDDPKQRDVSVAFAHMGARVDTGAHEIAFLYRLRSGVAAHSRGIECARLAGIGEDVLQRAAAHAKAFLQGCS